jgi:UDP-3-O-acyl N-acetylglucosamine deacetylase
MNKSRVLIVDDQEEILTSLEGILADEGHEVIVARDGQEAIHAVQSDSPHIVFLDIWIPGIDGMQTLKAIKKIDPACSVIMMSGHGTIETAVKAIKLGADDYLEKPLNLEDVLHYVESSAKAQSEQAQARSSNGGPPPRDLIGVSPSADRLRQQLKSAAQSSDPVWLYGDEGTGKEFAARVLHDLTGNATSALVKVRCSDLTAHNFDETFYGRPDNDGRPLPGKLAQAEKGTLLLLRIDRLAPSLAPHMIKLAGRLGIVPQNDGGGTRFNGRIVCTALVSPEETRDGEPLPSNVAHALGVQPIRVPGLKERPEDIPLYVEYFLKEAVEEFESDIKGAAPDALERLVSYSWPGNVKELKILLEHVVMTAPGDSITAADLLIPNESDISGQSEDSANGVPGQKQPHPVAPQAGAAHAVSSASENVPAESGIYLQKTLRGRVVMYGQGLHSGVKTGLTLSPLPPGSGILFGHITAAGTVPALLDKVKSTDFCTSLTNDGTTAGTIEHLMAVFHVYGLTNVLVKISGEVPIMDGSAVEFCHLIEGAELIRQEGSVDEIRITETIELPVPPDSQKSLRVEPSDCLEVEYFMDYPPPIGSQHYSFRCDSPEAFKEQIAPARTFGFVKDVRMMDEMGLAGGGRLSNLVLVDEEKVVNPPLRFPDEFVRHKILDIIGDFYLLGRPFIGRIVARQTGHADNVAMLRLIGEKLALL